MTLEQPPPRKRSIHNARIAGLYDLEETIGKGHFAVVKLARHVFTGEKVACKIIDKANLDPQSRAHIMQEVRCMKLVQHPNIVRLYEVIDTQTKLFLCLELGDYDMHDFIIKHEKGVAEPLAQQYFCQIITAIDYCHKLHVVHRDLKPENVVFFEKLGMVKLTDFGFSNLYEPGQQLKTSCGSLAYSAPEILLGDAYDAPAIDVWSLGVILYMLVCGRLPFNETNDSETLTKILDCKYSFPDYLSVLCKSLIQRMLVRDPAKRAGLTEIVANSWVSAGDRGHAQELPLIVLHHLSHSAHTTIIEQMVAGNIGSEEGILRALENDEYNSMTATYFLLAERILASCREEKAKELMEKENAAMADEDPFDSGDSMPRTPAGGAKCRSRSNSWRARPCTILKEESEEELSTYLRSTSRQSSRLVSPGTSTRGRCSRQPSEDSVASAEGFPERPAQLALSRVLATPCSFDDLSPILEDMAHRIGRRKKTESMGNVESSVRRALFGRTISEPEWLEGELEMFKDDRPNCRLVRRNSSPSVSMFSGSAKDRISPQAIHELLEFSRIGARRAASPDSVRSSRSPSPPASSSGRTSPAISSLSAFARLKVAPSTSSSGMRKLSSSPHLLGICEEGEEGGGDCMSAIAHLSNPMDGMSRSNRSASTGLVHTARHGPVQATKSTGSHPQPTTYSAVRMIRPRHAVVSPDVCRRYEQHQRFINRTRRSASCSSSEASDDEEGKRLSLIGSKHCGLKKDRDRRSDDDDSNNGGLSGGGPSSNVVFSIVAPSGNGSTSPSQNAAGDRNPDTRGAADTVSCSQPVLMPIPEMPQLDSDSGERIRAKFLHRSHTAERVLRDWAGLYSNEEEDCWLGTPPRDIGCQGEKNGEQWIKKLQRTRSHGDISTIVFCNGEDSQTSVVDSLECELLNTSESSSHSENPETMDSDSGCSSAKAAADKELDKSCAYTLLDPHLVFDQPRLEKVDSWLRRSQFV